MKAKVNYIILYCTKTNGITKKYFGANIDELFDNLCDDYETTDFEGYSFEIQAALEKAGLNFEELEEMISNSESDDACEEIIDELFEKYPLSKSDKYKFINSWPASLFSNFSSMEFEFDTEEGYDSNEHFEYDPETNTLECKPEK